MRTQKRYIIDLHGVIDMSRTRVAYKKGVELIALWNSYGELMRYELYWDDQFLSSNKDKKHMLQVFDDLTQD